MKKSPLLRAALWIAVAIALAPTGHGEPFAAGTVQRCSAARPPVGRTQTRAEAGAPTPTGTVYGSGFRMNCSYNRKDYPLLTDEEFANFRNVATTGMGRNVLYRSSSPVDPEVSRNIQADVAAKVAGIRTVLNLADKKSDMTMFPGYWDSYYSKYDVIALHMSTSFDSDRFRNGFARGVRYLITHDGPYLVHCTMGRDRTGFVCAVLECLMGASADEVFDDYMLTFYNYYGILPGTDAYDYYLERRIASELAAAFGIDSLTSDRIDLALRAEDYLLELGLTRREIAALKRRLTTDIP